MPNLDWITDLYMSVYNWISKQLESDLQKSSAACVISAIFAGILIALALLWAMPAEAESDTSPTTVEASCPKGQYDIDAIGLFMEKNDLRPVSIFVTDTSGNNWTVMVGEHTNYTALMVTYPNYCSEIKVAGFGMVWLPTADPKT